MLAMRQILLGPMGAPTPPLPYDYAVEYVQRDCSIATTAHVGIDFGVESVFAGQTSHDVDLSLEVECSVYGASQRAVWIFGYAASGSTGTFPRVLTPNSSTSTIIRFGVSSLGDFSCSSSSDYKKFRMDFDVSDNTISGYVDDALIGQSQGIGTFYLYSSTNSTDPTPMTWIGLVQTTATTSNKTIRVKRVSLKRDGILVIDGTPCVKGDTVGWYNSVDGSLRMISMTDYPAFSAGPRI